MNLNFDITKQYNFETICGTTQSLLSVTSQAINFSGLFTSSEELSEAKTVVGGLLSAFFIHSAYVSIQQLLDTSKKNDGLRGKLNSVNAVIRLGLSLLSGIKLMDTLGALNLAKISAEMGRVSVVGQIFSFGNVTAGLGMVSSIINIIIDSITIYERDLKIERAVKKINTWETPIDIALIEQKILKNPEKKKQIEEKLPLASEELSTSAKKLHEVKADHETKKQAYQNADGIYRISTWIEMKKASRLFETTKTIHLEKSEALAQIYAKLDEKEEKLVRWKTIKASFNDNAAILENFRKDKKTKWEGRLKSLKYEQIMAGVGLFLKTVGLVITVSLFVIGTIGISCNPLMITLTTISLGLAVGNLMLMLLKRHTTPVKMKGVAVPLCA